jgi:hypothetical protein
MLFFFDHDQGKMSLMLLTIIILASGLSFILGTTIQSCAELLCPDNTDDEQQQVKKYFQSQCANSLPISSAYLTTNSEQTEYIANDQVSMFSTLLLGFGSFLAGISLGIVFKKL